MAFITGKDQNGKAVGTPAGQKSTTPPQQPPNFSSPLWDERRACYTSKLGSDWKAWDGKNWTPIQTYDNCKLPYSFAVLQMLNGPFSDNC